MKILAQRLPSIFFSVEPLFNFFAELQYVVTLLNLKVSVFGMLYIAGLGQHATHAMWSDYKSKEGSSFALFFAWCWFRLQDRAHKNVQYVLDLTYNFNFLSLLTNKDLGWT